MDTATILRPCGTRTVVQRAGPQGFPIQDLCSVVFFLVAVSLRPQASNRCKWETSSDAAPCLNAYLAALPPSSPSIWRSKVGLASRRLMIGRSGRFPYGTTSGNSQGLQSTDVPGG